MKNLLIIGARGFGREVYCLALRSLGYGEQFVVKGYLDDKADALDGFEGYPPILGGVEKYDIQPNDVFICALGDVRYKKKYVQMILDRGGEFWTLIDQTAVVFATAKIGIGCIVFQFATVSCDVTVGDYVTIHGQVTIGHDAVIGDWASLGTGTFFGGYSVVEPMATVHTLGIVLPHKKVGEGAIVGAGAVVMRNVPAEATVFGNPAKLLRIE